MAGENTFFIPNRRQINAFIPANKQRKISLEMIGLLSIQWRITIRSRQRDQPQFPRTLSFAHDGETNSSICGAVQAAAACTKAEKIAREAALSMYVRSGCHWTARAK